MIAIEVDPHGGIFNLNIDAPLASANVRSLSERSEAEVARAGGLRGLVIRAPHFPVWRDLSGFLDKLRALQEFRSVIQRIAVVTESSPMDFAAQLAKYFPAAEIDRFSPQRWDRAEAWVHGANAAEGDAVILSADEPVAEPLLGGDSPAAAEVVLEESSTEAGEEDDWFV